MKRIAILGYHKVGPPPPGGWESWFYVPQEVFEAQLRELRAGGWEPIGADALVRGLDEPSRLPERAALITFDDGYSSLLDVALPALERDGWPGVLFMPSDYVGGTNAFDRDNEPEERLCGWEELRELARRGISIESHAASHTSFSELTARERREEIERSKSVLEDGLGSPVRLLSYPYGDAGGSPDTAADLERAGYAAACGYGGGPVALPAPDRYRLERLAMGPDSDLTGMLEGST